MNWLDKHEENQIREAELLKEEAEKKRLEEETRLKNHIAKHSKIISYRNDLSDKINIFPHHRNIQIFDITIDGLNLAHFIDTEFSGPREMLVYNN